MASISLYDGLQPGVEATATVNNEVRRQIIPGLDNVGLQLCQIAVRGGPGLCVHDTPNSKIEGVEVRDVWRPKLLVPEGSKIPLKEFSALISHMRPSPILLEHIVPHGVGFL